MYDEALIESLKELRPTKPEATAVQIAFEAGRRSMRSSQRRWRAMAALLAVGLTMVFTWRDNPQPRQHLVAIVSAPPLSSDLSTQSQPLDSSSALALRSVLLAGGVENLPRPRGVTLPASLPDINNN
jgi:hypothetical protein